MKTKVVPPALNRQMAKVQKQLDQLMAPDCPTADTPGWWSETEQLTRELHRLGLRASPDRGEEG